MTKRVVVLIVALFGFAVADLLASGQAGIYGVVERVVFEPNKDAPERVQVWGAFALVEHSSRGFTNYVYTKPARGYLYFRLPAEPAHIENAKREWADLATVAGTRQAVAFGYWDRYRGDTMMVVRDRATKPENPDRYYTDIGVTKLSAVEGGHRFIVADLLKLVPPSISDRRSASRR